MPDFERTVRKPRRIEDDPTIMLKLIETSDPAVVDDIVPSTNRQAKIDEHQFLATLDAVMALDRYFDARGADDEVRLYFERRTNEFSHQKTCWRSVFSTSSRLPGVWRRCSLTGQIWQAVPQQTDKRFEVAGVQFNL